MKIRVEIAHISYIFSLICLFIAFLMVNIADFGASTGTVIVLLFLLGCFALVIFTGYKGILGKIPTSLFALLVFLIYFAISLMMSIYDIDLLISFTVATTGGVIFAVLCGLACNICLHKLHIYLTKDLSLVTFARIFTTVLLACTCLFSYQILLNNLANVRADIFLLSEDTVDYQRPAAFMLMIFVFLCALVASLVTVSTKNSKVFVFTNLALCFVLSAIFMMLSQLIGSNSGLVTILITFVIFTFFILSQYLETTRLNQLASTGFYPIIFSRLGVNLFVYGIICCLVLGLIIYAALLKSGIDLSVFRIFGFGTGDNSSVNSRMALYDNFLIHLDYSPIFGNMFVDIYTTGQGSYLHSILSIVPHLGIVGTFLFILLLVLIYRDVTNYRANMIGLCAQKSFFVYRLAVITSVLLFCTFSTFFTWIPLWFTLAFLGIIFNLDNNAKRSCVVTSSIDSVAVKNIYSDV
ncbi:MAG: hypothetical protein WA981_00355 [Glaciecola sp.]